jgi:hypothetical protein
MSTPSFVHTCEIEPVENHVCAVQNHCRVFEVDIQEHLILGSVETSAERQTAWILFIV